MTKLQFLSIFLILFVIFIEIKGEKLASKGEIILGAASATMAGISILVDHRKN